MMRLALVLSTFGYLGFSPVAPGTVGSVAGLGLYALIRWSGVLAIEPLVLGALLLAGIWSATMAGRHFGTPDPSQVVIDEVVGMLLTLALLEVGWSGALTGFLLFRLFDVTKPYPAARLERWPGGLGVMADDVMAGIYAQIALRIALRLFPGWVS
jgi:phosphatidylglycerophosphatase A